MISMVFIILPAILVKTRSKYIYIRVLSTGGRGELPPKVFLKKKLKLFQRHILFDDDIKESVKATNVQKCNFGQS